MSGRVRPGVKRRIQEIAQHVLGADVRVTYTWDGKPVAGSTMWLGPVEGSTDPETIGRQPLDTDLFEIPVRLEVLGLPSPEEAEDRVMALVNRLEEALRVSHRLAQVPGLNDGDAASYLGVSSVRISDMDGPGHGLPDRGAFFGWCEFSLSCTSNIG